MGDLEPACPTVPSLVGLKQLHQPAGRESDSSKHKLNCLKCGSFVFVYLFIYMSVLSAHVSTYHLHS